MSFKLSMLQKHYRTIVVALLLISSLAHAQTQPSIIPKPAQMALHEGFFEIDTHTVLQYAGSAQLKPAADWFAKAIKQISGIKLATNKPGKKGIILKLNSPVNEKNESYRMQVNGNGIEISAHSYGGIFYGLQTLLQTLPAIRTNAVLKVPYMEINDTPRFKWRGMHLDVSRHFFGPELVKQYIDLMATYKLNTFHWHLVDDQGWRIEIKKYPKLTETGAWRVDQTDKMWSNRPQAKAGEMASYGGYYTQQQIKEIVAYAKTRNITIVPEIEMPGHVASAIAAYPQLSCNQLPQLPLTGGDYTNTSSNYCAGNEEVFHFLQDVLTETMAIFPSAYIHIGGDEVEKAPWKKCEKCQARMQKEGLKNEEELQSYFIKRIEKFVVSKGRKMIGWDEILEGGLAPEATVMSWRGEAGGIEAAKMNHQVVMTPGSPLYFDHYQAGPEGEPRAFGGMNTLKRVYEYDPIPAELPADKTHYILGAQANLWAEHITTAAQVQYMALPRMLALAEVVWSQKSSRNYIDFNNRLQAHFKAFDQKGIHYSKGNFKVTIAPFSANGQLQVHMSNETLNSTIHYTTDGTEPSNVSPIYTTPIAVTKSGTIKASTVVNGEVKSIKPSEQSFAIHLACGANVQYTNPVSKSYLAEGPNTLTDGVRGIHSIGKNWHGFSGKDLIATIDLGKMQSIKLVSIGFIQRYTDWIFLPQWVKFEWSADGTIFTEITTVQNDISPTEKASTIKNFAADFAPVNARFIRVLAKVIDGCPKGHVGEGKPGWLFADEIVVQ